MYITAVWPVDDTACWNLGGVQLSLTYTKSKHYHRSRTWQGSPPKQGMEFPHYDVATLGDDVVSELLERPEDKAS